MNSGIRTINAIAIENGDPTYDMPEADEPFVLTATGPVFLRGLLERQEKEAAVPPPGSPGAPPDPNSQPAPAALAPADDSSAEVDKFVKFATRRIADGIEWRDFAFEKLDSAAALPTTSNALGPAPGDMEAMRKASRSGGRPKSPR